MATLIIFLRHGATELNERGLMQGDSPVPLSELGREQIRRAARALSPYHPVKVYHSPAVRAHESAQLVASELNVPTDESSLLREQGLGEWEGKRWKEVAAADPDIEQRRDNEGWWFCPPGGEPRLRVRHRMLNYCSRMEAEHPNETVVAVTHAGALYFFLLVVLGLEPLGRQPIRTDNGGFSVIQVEEGKLTCISLNESAHLRDLHKD